MSVSRQSLFVFAILLWLIGAYKVLGIGLEAWSLVHTPYKFIWLFVALSFFMGFVFPKVVQTNSRFILGLEGIRFPCYQCMKPSSWLIMTFMITLGVVLRRFSLVPDSFIAGFYTGLGTSLAMVSLFFYGRELLRLNANNQKSS